MTPNDVRSTPHGVVLVGPALGALMRLTLPFSEMRYGVTTIEAERPLRAAQRWLRTAPAAMIIVLDGDENIADVRTVLDASNDARCLFLIPDLPPRAALARVVSAHGGAIVGSEESAAVIAGTLVALLADRAEEAV
jgi:hypothetical protein